jgi:hypothetical protein
MNKVLNKEEGIKYLTSIGINSKNYYTKSTFRGRDGKPKISLFANELKDDFYCQIVTQGQPLDKVITIYKVPYNPDNLNRDYDIMAKDSNTEYKKYIFDLTEIKPVYKLEEKEKEDAPFSSMSMRDYVCIHTGVPESSKAWVNRLIMKSPIFNGKSRFAEV